jgi:hypothetical protein
MDEILINGGKLANKQGVEVYDDLGMAFHNRFLWEDSDKGGGSASNMGKLKQKCVY